MIAHQICRGDQAAQRVPHQDYGNPEFASLGEQVSEVVDEFAEVIDEGPTAAGFAETTLVEAQRVVASNSECPTHVFVAARVFADAMNKQDCCFWNVSSPVPPKLRESIAFCTEADRRCVHGRSSYLEGLALNMRCCHREQR